MADEVLYKKLAATAKAHLVSCLPKTKGSNDVHIEAILPLLAPSFRIDFGHEISAASTPGTRGQMTTEQFVQHLSGMAKALQTWSAEINNTVVDTQTRTVVIRVDFRMVPKGAEEVMNDILLWVVMDHTGDKIMNVTEFIDPAASAKLAASLKAGATK